MTSNPWPQPFPDQDVFYRIYFRNPQTGGWSFNPLARYQSAGAAEAALRGNATAEHEKIRGAWKQAWIVKVKETQVGVAAFTDSAESAMAAAELARLNACIWCGKRDVPASGWEQEHHAKGWQPLCRRCAGRRLRNPFNAILLMRKIAG